MYWNVKYVICLVQYTKKFLFLQFNSDSNFIPIYFHDCFLFQMELLGLGTVHNAVFRTQWMAKDV
jgi:hypothetical protein